MVVISPNLPVIKDAAVAQWVNAFPLQTEGGVFKSQPRQIQRSKFAALHLQW